MKGVLWNIRHSFCSQPSNPNRAKDLLTPEEFENENKNNRPTALCKILEILSTLASFIIQIFMSNHKCTRSFNYKKGKLQDLTLTSDLYNIMIASILSSDICRQLWFGK